MSICSHNHVIKDGKSNLENINFWRCTECRKNVLMGIGLILLIFIVPICLNLLIKWNPIIVKETEEAEAIHLGAWIVFIMWWMILGMFLYYRKKIKDLKTKLLETNALNNRITQKDINDIYKFYGGNIWGLRKFLVDAIEKEKENRHTKTLEIINHNVQAIDSMDLESSSYEKYENFWKKNKLDYKNENWTGLQYDWERKFAISCVIIMFVLAILFGLFGHNE